MTCSPVMTDAPPPAGIKLPRTFRGRFAALRNVWPILQMVWKASPRLMVIALLLPIFKMSRAIH